jgi:hypothetical protein
MGGIHTQEAVFIFVLEAILQKFDVYGIKFFEKLNIWGYDSLNMLWNEQIKIPPKIAIK